MGYTGIQQVDSSSSQNSVVLVRAKDRESVVQGGNSEEKDM